MTDEANPRIAAGGNMPPPVDTMAIHIEDLFALVSGSTAGEVTTDEQEAALDQLLDDVRQARRDADDQRVIEKRPHDLAADAVQAAWKPLLARCDAATAAIKAALTPYRTAKQKAKDAAAQKARDEAAEKLAQAQVALRSSDDLETRFDAEEQLKQAGKLAAVANKIDRAPTGLRTYWTATVTEYPAMLRWIKERHPTELREFLDRLAHRLVADGAREIPGVKIEQEKRAA